MERTVKRWRLPIGIQDFRTIREEGYYYVDKTPIIRRIVNEGRHYFLSRPRRFGKSLLVDTLKSLFEGGRGVVPGAGHPPPLELVCEASGSAVEF